MRKELQRNRMNQPTHFESKRRRFFSLMNWHFMFYREMDLQDLHFENGGEVGTRFPHDDGYFF